MRVLAVYTDRSIFVLQQRSSIMKNKKFDCIAVKRAAQQAIRSQVRGMTRKQEIAFFREGAEDFEQRIEETRRRRERLSAAEQDR